MYKIIGVFQMCLEQKDSKAKSIKLSMKVGTEYWQRNKNNKSLKKILQKHDIFKERFSFIQLFITVCSRISILLKVPTTIKQFSEPNISLQEQNFENVEYYPNYDPDECSQTQNLEPKWYCYT